MFLSPPLPAPVVIGTLLLYRLVYYLVPLVAAITRVLLNIAALTSGGVRGVLTR